MKFEKFMEEKDAYSQLTEKVLTLGHSNDSLAKNFVTLNKRSALLPSR